MVCCQLHNRFTAINKECGLFNFLNLSVLISLPENDIIEYSQKFYLKYSNDLSVGFTLQLVTLISITTVKKELHKVNSIK